MNVSRRRVQESPASSALSRVATVGCVVYLLVVAAAAAWAVVVSERENMAGVVPLALTMPGSLLAIWATEWAVGSGRLSGSLWGVLPMAVGAVVNVTIVYALGHSPRPEEVVNHPLRLAHCPFPNEWSRQDHAALPQIVRGHANTRSKARRVAVRLAR